MRTDMVWSPTPEKGITSGYITPNNNIYVADVSLPEWMQGRKDFVMALAYSADGGRSLRRATRARFPNADPELDQYPVVR